MVATMRGTAGHDIITIALSSLRNLEHRGAVGSDAGTGDGAGIQIQIPDRFFRSVLPFELPAAGRYAAGIAFLPVSSAERELEKSRIADIARGEGLSVLGWRTVPTDPDHLGSLAREVMPAFEQVFLSDATGTATGIDLDRKTFRLRKRAERELGTYFPSLSCRTLVYKGMVTTLQLEPFFPDLSDERIESTLAIVHSRFSTNTFPSWSLAQPFRYISHNGEINTINANRNWMHARQSQLSSELLGDVTTLFPIVTGGASDSASFDEVVELLELAGRSLPHAIMMMVPEAWENDHAMDSARRDFYRYHSSLMEPWDGPAALAFSDSDPHNLVACLRVADGAGAHAVVAPKDHAVGLNATVAKVASGAAETVPYLMVTNLARTLNELKERGIQVVGTAEDAGQTLFDIDFTGPVALVLGAEGPGMRALTKKTCDTLVRIPMAGAVESLNVSVAAGVCLFEALRQRRVAANKTGAG
jgi:glutamate synthase domain-containing protein 1